MSLLSAVEIEAGLVRSGVPRELARRRALELAGESRPRLSQADAPVPEPPTIAWPLRLTLPWSALISDNVKLRAARRGDSATVVLTPEYRIARDRIKALAATLMAGHPPLASPLALLARVWVPDQHRRDVVNFSKSVQDALTKRIYADDCWLYDVRWVRAGVDVDAPRAELSITPLSLSDVQRSGAA